MKIRPITLVTHGLNAQLGSEKMERRGEKMLKKQEK
jgi:hypothetical protein